MTALSREVLEKLRELNVEYQQALKDWDADEITDDRFAKVAAHFEDRLAHYATVLLVAAQRVVELERKEASEPGRAEYWKAEKLVAYARIAELERRTPSRDALLWLDHSVHRRRSDGVARQWGRSSWDW